MRICPYCGSLVEDNAPFCGNCGTAMPAPQPPAQSMTFCPNCGQQLPAGSAFCPNCGAALGSASAPEAQQPGGQWQATQPLTDQWQAPQQPNAQWQAPQQPNAQWQTSQQPGGQQGAAGKPKARTIGIAAAAVAAVVVVIAAVAAFKILPDLFASPSKKFLAYQQELFLTELLSGLESGLDRYGSFSTDLIVTASVDEPDINRYLDGSAVKLGIDLNKDSVIAGGELVLMGSPVLNGTVTYDGGRLGFLLPQADNTYYVLDLEEAVKNLYGEDLDLDGAGMPEISGKQWRALIEAYLDVVYSTVNDGNVTEEKGVDVRLPGLGGSFTGTVYTFRPTAEDIEDMFLRLADRLEGDKDLREAITLLLTPASAFISPVLYDSYGSRHENSFSIEDEMEESILRFARQLRSYAAQTGRSVEESGFAWTLAVEGKNVRQISISVRNGDAFVYEAEGTASDKRTELIYITSYGERQELVERSYTKKGSECEGRITISAYDAFYAISSDRFSDNSLSQRNITLDYRYDRGKTSVFGIPYGEYRLSIPDVDVSVKLSVAAGAGGSADHTLSIDMGDEYAYYNGFRRVEVNINATDKSSVSKPVQRPVDISGYSEDELYELFYGLGYALGNELVYNTPLLGLLYGW